MLQAQVLIDNGKSKFWVVPEFSPDLYPHLCQIPLYEEPPIFLMGEWRNQRRNIGFFSDESKGYKYSGTFIPAMPLGTHPVLPWLLTETNKALRTNFNGILINDYKDGTKKLGAHSDEEWALDKSRRLVVGIAYGPGVRKFRIRDKATKQIVLDYEHQPRTLIGMEGDFQKTHTHEIPEQKRVKERRISVTFRHHLE